MQNASDSINQTAMNAEGYGGGWGWWGGVGWGGVGGEGGVCAIDSEGLADRSPASKCLAFITNKSPL